MGMKTKRNVQKPLQWRVKQGGLAKCFALLLTAGMMLGAVLTPMQAFAAEPAPTTTPENWWREGEITHGTATEWITEDMLNNTPPEDYVIDSETQGKAEDGEYNKYFLKDDIQTVHIKIDENNLNYLLQNALAEPYVMTNSVTIGDTTLGYCGLRTKGAYTLEHSYTDNPGSDRFSFTINFGKYIKKAQYGKKQDFYGANKISFNNFFFDKSMLKEFCALTIMEEMGLPTPQFGLAKLYINGEYYGVYAMVETFDESILEQYYGVDDDDLSSYLVKPEGTTFLREQLAEDESPLWEKDEDTYEDVQDMLPTVRDWVEKLNLLSEGKDFEGNEIDVNSDRYVELLSEIYDLDEVLKYFAAHSWLVQLDSIFSGMKNFGLYIDEDGRAMVMPWDYDLSFGCYFPTNAQWTANYDIDALYMLATWGQDITGLTPGKDSYKDYPMFNVIWQNDTLMERYHGYMKDCSKIAALGGTVEATGKSYEPGFINARITALENVLFEAAKEKTTKSVYYMNNIRQPSGVQKAKDNLSKIIAMRAVGVVLQVDEVDSVVCAAGCELDTLGNGAWGPTVTEGTMTVVSEQTGMYITTQYESSRRLSPLFRAAKVTDTAPKYAEITGAMGATDKDVFTIYYMTYMPVPIQEMEWTMPLETKYLENVAETKVYSYMNGEIEEIKGTIEGNLFRATVDAFEYVIVTSGMDIATAGSTESADSSSTESETAGKTEDGSGAVGDASAEGSIKDTDGDKDAEEGASGNSDSTITMSTETLWLIIVAVVVVVVGVTAAVVNVLKKKADTSKTS